MRSSFLPAMAGMLCLCACDSQRASSPVSGGEGSARVSLTSAPLRAVGAARAAAAEPGGRLIVTLTNSVQATSRADTLAWEGADTLRAAFEGLAPGAGYRLTAQYLDARNLVTHRDSVGPFALGQSQDLGLSLSLKAVLGKILLQFPSIPAGVGLLGLQATSAAGSWSTTVKASGKGALRLDSLPIGVRLAAHLWASDTNGSVLYSLDTAVTLSGSEDLALAWTLGSTAGRIAGSLVFLDGGEAAAMVGFSGGAVQPAAQTGRLLITGFSDSGASDWVRITNPGAAFNGTVRLSRSTGDTSFGLVLAAGESRIVTRASAGVLAQPGHPLGGSGALTGSVATVTWSSSTSTVWSLRSGDGSAQYDLVFVLSGSGGWPSLNASTRRTLVLRADAMTALGNDAGSNWCAQATDSPAATCP